MSSGHEQAGLPPLQPRHEWDVHERHERAERLNSRSVGRGHLGKSASNTSLSMLAKAIENAARSATNSLNRSTLGGPSRGKLPWGPAGAGHTRLLDDEDHHDENSSCLSEGGRSDDFDTNDSPIHSRPHSRRYHARKVLEPVSENRGRLQSMGLYGDVGGEQVWVPHRALCLRGLPSSAADLAIPVSCLTSL